MDIESLYELAGKPIPDTISKAKMNKVGTCSRDKSSAGNTALGCKSLNINGNKELFPDVPLVPSVLTNPVNSHSAHVGGGEVNSCAEKRERGINLLSKAASELKHPLDDLLSWYANDLDIISEYPLETVKVCVRDYIANIKLYRSNHRGK